MFNLKKSSLLILFAMFILVLMPMSFASDADATADDLAIEDVDSVAVDDLAIEDVDSVAATDDVDIIADSSNEDLGSTPVPDSGAFVYFANDEATINEGCSTSIKGEVRYSYGMGSGDVISEGKFPITLTYTDGNGDTQTYSTTASSGKFSFDTASFTGLTASSSPYILNILAEDDSSKNAASYTGSSNIASATFTLTVNAVAAPEPIKDGNSSYVQNLVNQATSGSTVDLTAYDTYDFENNTVTVTKDNIIIKGNGATVIKGHGGYTVGSGKSAYHAEGALFEILANNVTITGINFEDTNDKSNVVYGGNVEGWGIRLNGGDGAKTALIENCTFKDFDQAIVVATFDYATIKNCNFTGGIATLLINDPSVNKEQGSKVISVGGSFYTTIEGCIFDGPVLDAISIAQASGDAMIKNNQFINNAYAIFFGGASTDGTYIINNTFTNCGMYKDATHDYSGFAVISIEKAASGVYIDGNTFYAVNDNMLIKGEQGNTAHGSPSTLGDINVTNNKVLPSADATNFVGSSVTLFHINCVKSILNPYAAVYVNGNILTKGVRALVVWSTEWGTEDAYNKTTGQDISDVTVPKADLVKTQITNIVINDGTITGKLVDATNKGINAQTIICTGASANTTATTDKNGVFTVTVNSGESVVISYAAGEKYDACEFAVTLPAKINTDVPDNTSTVKNIASKITVSNVNVLAGDNGQLKITLKDANNKAIDGKTVSVIIDGVSKNVAVKNGVATLNVKYATAGTHYVTAYFNADGYTSSIGNAKITVAKKATKITASKATLKVKKAKKLKISLKSGSKAVAKQKVTIKVNGKTFTAKTNAKGVATISVKITKKGKFTATISYAGNGAYKAAKSVKVKYTVK